jgi:4-aminobutyrate aminotransferase/(S)-3-amino-2-methylpropionate transaminase
VLEIIREERLIERAREIGRFMMARLQGLQARFPCIGDVRGVGAMVAIEIVKNNRADLPDEDLTKAIVQACGRQGLIVLGCGLYGNVVRFLAPLTIPDALLKEGFNLLEKALGEVASPAMAPAMDATGT